MGKKRDPHEADVAREDARRRQAEQFAAIQEIAESQHLPMTTMARAWLLDRLDKEGRTS